MSSEPRPLSAYPKPPKRGPKNPKRPRKQRKTSRAKLGRECDKLWSLLVRRKGACEACGGTNVLQGAHGFSRRYRATRWVLLNGFCLCRGCHVTYTHDPLGWDTFLRDAWGEMVYDSLRASAQFGRAPRDMEAVLAKLREEEGRDA